MSEFDVLSLEDCVREYLSLAILPPEKAPRTQRAQRDNEMLILGFNRAQETLRSILASHAHDAKALAETRHPDQRRPMEGPGGIKLWVAA